MSYYDDLLDSLLRDMERLEEKYAKIGDRLDHLHEIEDKILQQLEDVEEDREEVENEIYHMRHIGQTMWNKEGKEENHLQELREPTWDE